MPRRTGRPTVTLFKSVSLNGMIGRPGGEGDFFTNINWSSWIDLTRATGAMAWGRRTHDIFRRAAVPELRGIKGYVLTTDRGYRVEEGWKVAGSPQEAVELAAKDGVEGMLVVGGATTNAAFARAGLLDRVIVNVEGALIGQGMPMLAGENVDVPLLFRQAERLTDTVVRLHWDVARG